jgi:TetR/AcrR family transcriptional repressor of nem operon
VTNSTSGAASPEPQKRPGKRERLVDAATRLFHEQGVEPTTLAQIAAAADVPLGNVYYYFKTRNDITEAVVTAQVGAAKAGFAALEAAHRTPAARLKAWFRELSAQAEPISRYGCSLGTLSTELEKRAHGADRHAAQLLQAPIDWAERQFREMGRKDAAELAIQLIAAYEGSTVLAHAFGSPDLMRREARRIDRWIDTLRDRDAVNRSKPSATF